MERINDILGYENRKIFQDDECFSFSLDSVMLANFVSIRKRDKKILDLGTGNAVIPLILSLRTSKNIIGVELQAKLANLAIKSVEYNNLSSQITIHNIDMKNYVSCDNMNSFDIITCNPPYFKVNEKNFFNLSEEKKLARHELGVTLSDVFSVSKRLLKNGGNFAIVHRPERLMEIFSLFESNNIFPKRLQFVYEKLSTGSNLVLIEGQKGAKPGLKIERPFIIYNEDGSYTADYIKLCKEVINYESDKL